MYLQPISKSCVLTFLTKLLKLPKYMDIKRFKHIDDQVR